MTTILTVGAIVPNDVINVDALINQIIDYTKIFYDEDQFFIHCKNEEKFERNLEAQVPKLSYKISQIYDSGRDLAISVRSHICECLDPSINPLLKNAIDKLEPQLLYLDSWGQSEYNTIKKIYDEAGYDEWSVNKMLISMQTMFQKLSEILNLISIIKESYSYKIQSKEITLDEVRKLTRTNMTTTNNYNNSLISHGNNNTNTINNNLISSDELREALQTLSEIIDSSSLEPLEKSEGKLIISEISNISDKATFQSAYNKLTTFMSNHITIGTAILNANILPTLTQCLT